MRAGAHGLTIGGPPAALGVQSATLRPALGAVTGWMSGPALKPLTLRAVFEAARAVPDAPILAVGGVRTRGGRGRDAPRRRLRRTGGDRRARRSGLAGRHRARDRRLPQGEGSGVAERSAGSPSGAGGVPGAPTSRDPAPRRPDRRRPRRLDARGGRTFGSAPVAARRDAEGGSGARVGSRSRGRAPDRGARPRLRRLQAPRHPEHRGASGRQHRAARRRDAERARAGRRGDDARRQGGGGARRRGGRASIRRS